MVNFGGTIKCFPAHLLVIFKWLLKGAKTNAWTVKQLPHDSLPILRLGQRVLCFYDSSSASDILPLTFSTLHEVSKLKSQSCFNNSSKAKDFWRRTWRITTYTGLTPWSQMTVADSEWKSSYFSYFNKKILSLRQVFHNWFLIKTYKLIRVRSYCKGSCLRFFCFSSLFI